MQEAVYGFFQEGFVVFAELVREIWGIWTKRGFEENSVHVESWILIELNVCARSNTEREREEKT